MNIFLSIAAVVILFALLAYWNVKRFGSATLEQLPLHPSEKVLFEEEDVRVSAHFGPKLLRVFPHCTIRVTDRRVIIAQPAIGTTSKRMLRFVLDYTAAQDVLEAYRGYTTMRIMKEHIHCPQKKAKDAYVEILPDANAGFGAPRFVRIHTSLEEKYRRIFS